jgi:hypothetical protein
LLVAFRSVLVLLARADQDGEFLVRECILGSFKNFLFGVFVISDAVAEIRNQDMRLAEKALVNLGLHKLEHITEAINIGDGEHTVKILVDNLAAELGPDKIAVGRKQEFAGINGKILDFGPLPQKGLDYREFTPTLAHTTTDVTDPRSSSRLQANEKVRQTIGLKCIGLILGASSLKLRVSEFLAGLKLLQPFGGNLRRCEGGCSGQTSVLDNLPCDLSRIDTRHRRWFQERPAACIAPDHAVFGQATGAVDLFNLEAVATILKVTLKLTDYHAQRRQRDWRLN